MLRHVLHRRKLSASLASFQTNHIFAAQSTPLRLPTRMSSRNLIERPKTHEERMATNYYENIAKANMELLENEEEEEYTVADRLFRFKPLKELDNDDEGEDEFEGRPEKWHPLDDDYKMENGDPDPRMLLGKSLLSLGKVTYRHAESLPTWFLDRQDEISKYRTNPQIRKCLKDWMVKNDREQLDKYRKRSLKWGHKVGKNDKINMAHQYGPDETIAYSHYFLSSRFQVSIRVLNELKLLNPTYTPARVLDFGCGPATAAAALRHVYDTKDFKYTGIDISQSMLDAAKIMTRDTVKEAQFSTSSAEVIRKALQTHERYDLIVASFSLNELHNDPSKRIATQMLFELLDTGGYLIILESGNPFGSHTVRTARQFLLDTFNHVGPNGRTSEDGPSHTFFDKKELASRYEHPEGEDYDSDSMFLEEQQEAADKRSRDKFAMKKLFMSKKDSNKADQEEKRKNKEMMSDAYKVVEMMLPPPKSGGFSHEELGAYVVAPCMHDRPCPLALGVWCSFSQKVYSGVIRKSNEEKFSYVVMQKRPKASSYNYAPNSNSNSSNSSNAPDSKGKGKGKGKYKDKEKKSAPVVESANVIVGTTAAEKGKWGSWMESVPSEAEVRSDEATAAAAVANPSPLNVLQRFMEVEGKEETAELVDKLIDEVDWEEYDPPLHREEWGRLVRSPIKSKGHITLDMCTPEGQVVRSTLGKGSLVHVPALYSALRKTTWGGLFPVVSGDVGRSSLSKNAKGMRYRGNKDENPVETVVEYSKYGKKSSQAAQDYDPAKDKDKDKKVHRAYNIPGVPDGTVLPAEMVTASKSQAYRRLMDAQAAREEAEREREVALQKRLKRGGAQAVKDLLAAEQAQQAAAKEAAAAKPTGLSGQLERMKARREAAKLAAANATTGTATTANAVSGEE